MKHTGHKFLSVGALGLGVCLLITTAIMNMTIGYSIGADWFSAVVQAAAHAQIDLATAIFAAVAGVLFSMRRAWLGALAVLIALPFGLYSASGIMGWNTSNRVGVASALATNHQIAQKGWDATASTRTKSIEVLAGIAKSRGASKQTSGVAVEKIAQIASGKISALPKVSARDMVPDGQMLALKTWLKRWQPSEETIQAWLGFGFACLLIFGKIAAFAFGGYLWPAPAAAKTHLSVRDDLEDSETEFQEPENVLDLTQARENLLSERERAFVDSLQYNSYGLEEMRAYYDEFCRSYAVLAVALQPPHFGNRLKGLGWHREGDFYVRDEAAIAA